MKVRNLSRHDFSAAMVVLLIVSSPISVLGQGYPGEVVDVHNDPPLASLTGEGSANPGDNYRYLYNGSAFAQPFTPSLPILTAVQIALNPIAASCAAVEIRENSTSPVLGSRQLCFPRSDAGAKAYYRFSLSPLIALTPGKQYLILLYGTQASHGNLVLLAEIVRGPWGNWKGPPYLMGRLPNGTLTYGNPLFQEGLAFRTLGLQQLTITITTSTSVLTSCIIPVESGLTVHVVDERGNPIIDARILLNTTFPCALTNLSKRTDAQGNVGFGVTPGIDYNVTVMPPAGFVGGRIYVTVLRAAPPTAFTTYTLSITAQTLPAGPGPQIPGFQMESILIGLVLAAAFLVVIRKRSPRSA